MDNHTNSSEYIGDNGFSDKTLSYIAKKKLQRRRVLMLGLSIGFFCLLTIGDYSTEQLLPYGHFMLGETFLKVGFYFVSLGFFAFILATEAVND